MKYFLLFFLYINTAHCLDPLISYSESKYQKVDSITEVCSTGKVISNSETIGIYSIRLNGSDTESYVYLVFDKGGGSEKIFASSTGNVDIKLDLSDTENQVTGDGVKKIQVCLVNDKTVESPIIGGAYEAVKL